MEELKRLRRRKGWSQRDLSEASGVGQDTISGIESGRHEARPSTLRRLAHALGVEVVDLFEAQEPSDFGSDEVIDLSDDTGEALAWRIQTERDPYRAAGLEEIENNVLSLLSRYVKGGLDPLLHEMLVSSIPPYSRGLASYTLRQHEDGDQEDLESVVKNNFARVLARILEIADKQSDSS